MTVATGYALLMNYYPNPVQIYLLIRRLLPTTDVKYGGFDFYPVIWKIPSGYARTGAYIRIYTIYGGVDGNVYRFFCVGVCDFDTLGNRTETGYVEFGGGPTFIAFYDDTRELVMISPSAVCLALELLNPVNLQPVCYMIYMGGITSMAGIAVFATSNETNTGGASIIAPEPIRVKDSIKVSRMYFSTPFGLLTTRRLYSANNPNVRFASSIQIETKKFIPVGPFFVDVTDEL
jgi:hypothetical protein